MGGQTYLLGINNATSGNTLFGTSGYGVALNDGRYDTWLYQQTAGTVRIGNADVPLPAWAFALQALGLVALAGRRLKNPRAGSDPA